MVRKVILFNPFILFVFIWIFGLSLYSLQLSKLINFEGVFFIYILSFILLYCLLIYIFVRKIYITINLMNIIYALKKNEKIYIFYIFLFFIIGTLGFLLEVYKYHNYIPIFMENKINTGTPNHHIHYITQFSMYASLIGIGIYVFFRKRIFLIIYVFSIIELMIWLKRGEILPLIFSLIFFYYINAIIVNKLKRFYIIFIAMLSLFILFFAIIGNLRTEYVLEYIYHQTFNERYLMPNWIPSSFGWIYIYIATTLENARHIVFEQDICNYTFGTKLIYPFLAPFAKEILQTSYYPELANSYGLTVVSFIGDAVNDFGILGVYIYTFIYFIISYIGYVFINRGLFGIGVFIMAEMFLLWSIFANSISNGVYVIGFLIFLVLSLKYERFNYNEKSINNIS